MPRYTITIADIDLYINTEESPEMVETLVGIVDQRVRNILARSPRLSKSEAAILCSVDYCADKLREEKKARSLEHTLAELSAELELLKKDYANLAAETDEVRRENRILNDIIAKNMGASVSTAPERTVEIAQGEQLAIDQDQIGVGTTVAATDILFDSENDENIAAAPQKRRASRAKPSAGGKNKVGDMFDMLTFKDV